MIAMSRHKENIPLPTSQQPNGSLLSTSKYLPSDEFFTDSLLDATRLSSRIPSPSPQKQPLTKARRARTTRTTRNPQHSRPKAAGGGDSAIPRPRQKSLQPATPVKQRADVNRLLPSSVTTPPGSAGAELPLASPYTGISSPPPQDITDAYQQIEDAEDLAQTEREISSSDDSLSELDEEPPVRLIQRSKSESPLKAPPVVHIASAASTPTRSFSTVNRDRRSNDRMDVLSEASGLSFLKEMTDQNLAAKLTPHVSASARDKQKIRDIWGAQKPIAFSKADQPPARFNHGEASSIPLPKVTAFSKALRPSPNSLYHGIARDFTNRPPSQLSGSESQYSQDSPRRNERPVTSLPTNTRRERKFNFSTNHGFPQNRPALTEKNLEQQNRGSPITDQPLQPLSSAPSIPSDRSSNNAKVLDGALHLANGNGGRLPPFRRSLQSEPKIDPESPSQIDWAAAAKDIPLPSIENSFNSEKKDSTPMSISKMYSPDKTRRWDNDFTGQSFQVSESPPVRQRSMIQEPQREKEIEGVAKQAVTTNRLSQIRERQSQESLHSLSKSPAPRSTPRSSDTKLPSAAFEEDDAEVLCERVPNTPVVIYRSSSNSGSDKVLMDQSSERPSVDRSKSHDQLQRLARAMSSTPRSSPASTEGFKDAEAKPDDKSAGLVDKQDIENEQGEAPDIPQLKSQHLSDSASQPIAQTPRVTGAWTDTILPDTVKPPKQEKIGYAQTPHISAGGWIDTPAPIEQKKFVGTIPTIIEEVPEELTAGIGKDTASSATIKGETHHDTNLVVLQQPQPQALEQPKSALASILERQKNRLETQDLPGPTREDTLNLGNDTIESLQDLLDFDENDLTTLSRLSLLEDETKPLSELQADSEVLGRLSFKLDRLRNHIHVAQKGISKLEHQVSLPVEKQLNPMATTITTAQHLLNDTICQICNQQTFHPHVHTESTYLPYTPLMISLPIPLLFKPRKRGQLLPRPTLLGYLTIAIWAWYLVECTMCELYSRPEYTDFYAWPARPEPEFPFVLPTMLARWTGIENLAIGSFISWLCGLVFGVTRAAWRIFSMFLGWSDGFVDDGLATSKVVKRVVETAANLAASATGVDLSMNDDEYI